MPIAAGDNYSVAANESLIIAAPGVLANDKDLNVDEEGIALKARLATAPSHGKLKLSEDGSFTYSPAKGFTGSDTFRYRDFDGRLDSATAATVTIEVGSNSP